ncbi:MAG: cobalamin-dependent protein [Candidatus Omnitrophota bacterium]
MKTLLLNSPWINNGEVYGIKSGTRWPALRRKERSMPYFPFPYEMAQAAAYLRRHGVDASAKDAIAEELTAEQCLCFMESLRPALTVIEAFTPSIEIDLAFAEAAKRRTGTAVAFCGVHASALPEEVLKSSAVDYVLTGEYDETLKELCFFMDGRGGELAKIAGLAYKKDASVVVNVARPVIEDLDVLPCPEISEFPIYKYNEPLSRHSPNARVVTTRGCPTPCISPIRATSRTAPTCGCAAGS